MGDAVPTLSIIVASTRDGRMGFPVAEWFFAIPFFSRHIENGVFKSDEGLDRSAAAMLDELVRWDGTLKTLRP